MHSKIEISFEYEPKAFPQRPRIEITTNGPDVTKHVKILRREEGDSKNAILLRFRGEVKRAKNKRVNTSSETMRRRRRARKFNYFTIYFFLGEIE